MQGNGDEGLNDDSSSGAGGGVIRREIWELEVRELGVWLKPRDVKNHPPPYFRLGQLDCCCHSLFTKIGKVRTGSGGKDNNFVVI